MRGRRVWWVALTALALLKASGWALGASPEGPLPRPPTGAKAAGLSDDRRLERPVSLHEESIGIGELLARVTAECGVMLACDRALGRVPVAVYVESRPAGELLARVAALLKTQWEVGEGGGYRLARTLAPPTPDEVREALLAQEARVQEPGNEEVRQARAARVQEYRAALGLSRAELLSKYETADPWLCADLVDPVSRGMLRIACSLTPSQAQELTARGVVALPVVSLPAAIRRDLAHLAQGRWGPPNGGFASDPDRPSRFESPEERWAHSLVRLMWMQEGLRIQLTVPDVCRYQIEVGGLAGRVPEAAARRQLERLGVARRTTPPPGETGRAASGPAPAVVTSGSPAKAPPGAEAAAVGKAVVDLTSFVGKRAPAAKLLAEIARQCPLSVLAECVPSDVPGVAPRKGEAVTKTLGDVLVRMRSARRGLWSAEVSDGWLVASDAGAETAVWCELPEGLVEELRARVRGGRAIPLEDLAAFAAFLNPLQLEQLASEVRELQQIALDHLRLYGGLTAEQRAALLRGETVAVASLKEVERRVALRRARPTHPWFTEADLEHATLRLVRQTLCTEEPGVTLFLEYHRPESPRDRDVLFTSPLAFRPWGADDNRG